MTSKPYTTSYFHLFLHDLIQYMLRMSHCCTVLFTLPSNIDSIPKWYVRKFFTFLRNDTNVIYCLCTFLYDLSYFIYLLTRIQVEKDAWKCIENYFVSNVTIVLQMEDAFYGTCTLVKWYLYELRMKCVRQGNLWCYHLLKEWFYKIRFDIDVLAKARLRLDRWYWSSDRWYWIIVL